MTGLLPVLLSGAVTIASNRAEGDGGVACAAPPRPTAEGAAACRDPGAANASNMVELRPGAVVTVRTTH